MKKFLKSLFSKEGEISSKRVFGGIGIIGMIIFLFMVKLSESVNQISTNDVAVIKMMLLVFGLLVAGDSVTDIWKKKTNQ